MKTALTTLIFATTLNVFAEGVKVERSALDIGSYVDIGQIVKGGIADPATQTIEVTDPNDPTKTITQVVLPSDGAVLQRTAVYLNQTTTINDRLAIKIGVGGLFYYAFPASPTDPTSRSLRFGPGVGQAQGVYSVGDLNNPSWKIQFGYFPYKYNQDAKDLGEFLLRDGTYPGYEVTGTAGWSFINSALYMASGLRVNGNFLDGKLTADLNVFIERDIEPNHDLSPSVVLNYKPSELLDFGAGAEFAHLISFTPHVLKGRQYLIQGDSVLDQAAPIDSGDRFTFQGVKLMARASANFGSLLNNPWIGKEGLKLYVEGAILGVKNYPVYYNDILARMPIMVGINLPTLNFFDVLSVEYEYRKWDFINSTAQIVDINYPYWDVSISDFYAGKNTANSEAIKAQDNKWSVYGKKTITKGISIYAQAASDWVRGIDQNNNLTKLSITQRPSQWYYLFRLEFGI